MHIQKFIHVYAHTCIGTIYISSLNWLCPLPISRFKYLSYWFVRALYICNYKSICILIVYEEVYTCICTYTYMEFVYMYIINISLLWIDWGLYPFLDLTLSYWFVSALHMLWFWVLKLILVKCISWIVIFLLILCFDIEKCWSFVYSNLSVFSFVVLC